MSTPTYFHAPSTGGFVSGDHEQNVVIGSDYADILDGRGGDDLLTGGAGADRFEAYIEFDGVDYVGFGHDVITDFESGDTLDIWGWGTGGLDVSASYTATDTLLTFGAGTAWESSILLENHIATPPTSQPTDEFYFL